MTEQHAFRVVTPVTLSKPGLMAATMAALALLNAAEPAIDALLAGELRPGLTVALPASLDHENPSEARFAQITSATTFVSGSAILPLASGGLSVAPGFAWLTFA